LAPVFCNIIDFFSLLSIQHMQVRLVLMLRPDKSTCPWISLSRWPNPSIVTDQKFGMLHKTKVNKGRPMHLHVVRALEE
jgi:hypothetical protein